MRHLKWNEHEQAEPEGFGLRAVDSGSPACRLFLWSSLAVGPKISGHVLPDGFLLQYALGNSPACVTNVCKNLQGSLMKTLYTKPETNDDEIVSGLGSISLPTVHQRMDGDALGCRMFRTQCLRAQGSSPDSLFGKALHAHTHTHTL